MAWRCTGATNAELIHNLFREGLISSPRVRDAMLAVDRAHYCPRRTTAYVDAPQPIGYSATISAPHMHASAAESLLPLLPERSERPLRVLDVGSGSGYLTHVLAGLVGERGRVVGVEHIKELRDMGEENMARSETGRELLRSKKVMFVVGDGRKGWVDEEDEQEGVEPGWDAIHVGAAAKTIHEELVRQLRRPGR
jgi:protein-L-isoaspartate(D-aspartate) O-methyltransferase